MVRIPIKSFCLGMLLMPFMQIKAVQDMHGQKLVIEKEKVSNIGEYLRNKKMHRQWRSGSNCTFPGSSPENPLPILYPGQTVPLPNPTPLPGISYPNPAATNSLTPPPQTLGVNFIAGQQGSAPTFWGTPFNDVLAVGRSQVLWGANNGITSFDKAGNRDGQIDVERGSLFNLDGNYSVFTRQGDARLHYDYQANRFVLSDNLFDPYAVAGGYNGFILAVSDSDTISDSTQWIVFTVYNQTEVPSSTGCLGNVAPEYGTFYDVPNIGIDAHAIYVSTASILEATGASISGGLYVIQKSSLYNETDSVNITAFPDVVLTADGDFVGDEELYRFEQIIFPLDNIFDPNPSFGYVIAPTALYWGMLDLYRVVNPGSTTPSLEGPFTINVMQTFVNSALPQGCPTFPQNYFGDLGLLEHIQDDFTNSSHINKKQIFAAHSVLMNSAGICDPNNPGDRLGIRWYQLDVTGDPTGQGLGTETATTIPALVQAGTLFDSTITTSPISYNMPTISSNKNYDVAISASISGWNQNIAICYAGRTASDPLGTLRVGATPPTIFAEGSGSFVRELACGILFDADANPLAQRWGEQSMSVVDPVDKTTIWICGPTAINGLESSVIAQLIAP